MRELIRAFGPWGPIMLVLGVVVLALALRVAWTVARPTRQGSSDLAETAKALLFWGVAAAVLGFLGQCSAAFMALSTILAAPEISAAVVAEGFVISFLPALAGMGIFAFAAAVWGCVRFLLGRGARTATPVLPALLIPLPLLIPVALATLGCGPDGARGPAEIHEGVWTLPADPSVFLWEFASDPGEGLTCIVHDVQGGLKYTETPCASASLAGDSLSLGMPNGTRYVGRVDLAGGRVRGRLLYPGGGSMDAPLRWAPREDYPTLWPAAPNTGPFVYRVPADSGDGWPVAQAASAGVDPAALERAVEAVRRGEAGFLKSLLVARGGSLILDEYFHGYGPGDLSPLASCTKSISSLLVGLAIQNGQIPGVDTPLLDFFPAERAGAGTGWGDLTLEHLLTMSMALDWSPEEAETLHGTGPDAFRHILSRKVGGRPGEDWAYVNMNVNLLAGILRQATGEHAEAFAQRTLFEPLGIRAWSWDWGSQDGYNLMDGSLRLAPRDMARIGVMVASGGVWKGQRVLDEAWIRESLRPHLQAGPGPEGYGYLWWTMEVPGPQGAPLQVHFANGWGSQFILIFPALDLVVVTTGGNQENGKHLAIGEVLVRELLPGVGHRPA